MPVGTYGGLATNWESSSSGTPAMLLHCAQGSLAAWKGVSEALPGIRCIMPDAPGHGGSEYDPEQPYMQQAVNACVALLEAEAQEPAILIGHSYGGTISLRIAQQRPDLVKALAVYEPVNFGLLIDANHPLTRDKTGKSTEFRDTAAFQTHFENEDWPAAAKAFFGYWETERSWDSLKPQLQEYLIRTVRYIWIQQPSVTGGVGERMMLSDLADITLPVLVSHGEFTRDIAIATAELLSSNLPNATLKPLPGSGHMGPLKAAPAYATLLSEWIADLP